MIEAVKAYPKNSAHMHPDLFKDKDFWIEYSKQNITDNKFKMDEEFEDDPEFCL